MNRRTIITGTIGSAAIFALPANVSGQETTEVIDPKLTDLFGEDWASRKVTLGDSLESFDAVFGAYTDEEWVGDRSYRIPDVTSIVLMVEDTNQVSSIALYPYNSGQNRDTTPDENDDRRWTMDQSESILANLLPDDSKVTETCGQTIGNDNVGYTTYVEVMGTSDELYAKVLPETYAGTMDETPTQGAYGAKVTIEANDDRNPTDRVENVSMFLEAWDLDC